MKPRRCPAECDPGPDRMAQLAKQKGFKGGKDLPFLMKNRPPRTAK